MEDLSFVMVAVNYTHQPCLGIGVSLPGGFKHNGRCGIDAHFAGVAKARRPLRIH